MAAKQLYQLVSRRKLQKGDYVKVNGPWDTYGIVLKSEGHPDGFLNLIRGCDQRKGDKPVVGFGGL